MTCEKIQKLLTIYLDNDLQPNDNHIVRTHLLSCQACQNEAKALEKTWALLGEIPEIEPSPNYISRFYTKLSFEKSLYGQFLEKARRFIKSRIFVPSLVAMLAVIVVGVLTFANYQRFEDANRTMASIKDDDVQMLEQLELAQHFDVLEEMDFLEDADVIQQLDTEESLESSANS